MRTYKLILVLLFGLSVLLPGLFSCSPGDTEILVVDEEGNTTIDTKSLDKALDDIVIDTLTAVEQEGIVFMREEEKLAWDVYRYLFDTWGTNVFGNIGDSEQTHMDSMKTLIDRYDLDDPAEDMDFGEYSNEVLQKLYDDLIEMGGTSEIDALQVGAAIEEIDILDLADYLDQTEKQDIAIVYENLQKGSRNHLRSFVSVMEKRGIVYEPQYLSSEAYNDIVLSDIERGGR